MKKLLGIVLCVGTLMLGGCANGVADEDIITYLENIDTEGMSSTGLSIKVKFEGPLALLGPSSESEDEADNDEYSDVDLVAMVETLTRLFTARNDLEEYYSVLNKKDLKVLNEMNKKADDILAELNEKHHKLLIDSLSVISNGYNLPDEITFYDSSNEYDYDDEDDYYGTETHVDRSDIDYNTLWNCTADAIETHSTIIDEYGNDIYLEVSEDQFGGAKVVITVKGPKSTKSTPDELLSFVNYLPESITLVVIEFDGGYVNDNIIYDRLYNAYYFNEESSMYH